MYTAGLPLTNLQTALYILFCRTDFTIHGLWPDYDDGSYPSFCNSTDEFDPEKVRDLLPKLEAEWPTFASRGGDDFWAHEYEKHGTCATATYADEHEYFAGVLALNEQYDLLVCFSCCELLYVP